MVKRYGYLWDKVVDRSNLELAFDNACEGHKHKRQVLEACARRKDFLDEVERLLRTKTYKSGEYRPQTIKERGKVRVVYDTDFLHRVVHHALMNVLKPILMNSIGEHSFAAMQGRGSHQALMLTKDDMEEDPEGTQYCFQFDIKQFFPSIPQKGMVEALDRKIKDPDVQWLYREIIYGFPSKDGRTIPIGNYTSQYFANYYLSPIDHFLKAVFHAKHFRHYMDDYVIFGKSKAWLRRVKGKVEGILKELDLTLKHNWQIYKVDARRGVDFVGYIRYRDEIGRTYALLRKRTVKRLKWVCKGIREKLASGEEITEHGLGSLRSYKGVLQWGNCFNLGQKTVYPLLNNIGENQHGIST